MRPDSSLTPKNGELFKARLDFIIDMEHELVLLSNRLDWKWLEEKFEGCFVSYGRKALPIRLMAGLHIIKYMYNLSDEAASQRWLDSPYVQYFCGEDYFQHKRKFDRSSLTRWRKRLDEEKLKSILQESLRIAVEAKALKQQDLSKVIVDTTVQEKFITYPLESKIILSAIKSIGREAARRGIKLHQSYKFLSKEAAVKASRYLHAKQYNRAKRVINQMRTYLRKLVREVERKALLEGLLREKVILANRLLRDEKIYSFHAPEVECISKGKAHKRYEYGNKVSVTMNVTQNKGGCFVLYTKALHGNPYDGHTLKEVLEETQDLIGNNIKQAYVDKGYRGHKVEGTIVYKSGQKRGVYGQIKRDLKRRQAIEPIIGHLKNGCRMGVNYLKGIIGDKLNAIFAAIGFNFRQLTKYFHKVFLYLIQTWLFLTSFKQNLA